MRAGADPLSRTACAAGRRLRRSKILDKTRAARRTTSMRFKETMRVDARLGAAALRARSDGEREPMAPSYGFLDFSGAEPNCALICLKTSKMSSSRK